MTDFELALFEVKVALKKARESGYKKEPCIAAMELLNKLIGLTNDKGEQESIMALATELARRRKEVKEREDKEVVVPVAVNIDALFPLSYPIAPPDSAVYNTAVIESKNSYQDNALLLYSPFMDELDYVAECYAAKKSLRMRVVDLRLLVDGYPSQATEFIAALAHKAIDGESSLIVYKNLPALKGHRDIEESFCYYLKKMRQDARSVEQLLISNDITYSIENVYRDVITNTFPDSGSVNLYLQGIDFSFLPLPTMELTCAKLREKYMFERGGAMEKTIADNGIFLGYRGLSDMLSGRVCSLEEISTRLVEIKEQRKATLDEFIASFGEECIFDLGDWNYKKKKAAKKTVIRPDDPILNPKYRLERDEYDTVIKNSEIITKLERLLNAEGVSLPVKCAWAANFALDGGDMLNVINLPPEQAEILLTERWELAYKALINLMMIPNGKIVFDIPKSNNNLYGQCCDNGNTIRMNARFLEPKSVDDIAAGIDTLLHECYHALQFTAMAARRTQDQAKLGYYLVHFGVHRHIVEWEKNFSRYRSSEKDGYENYEDQVVEAEARIFAADCIDEYANFNAPRLD